MMGVDDLVETEVAVAVGATAIAASRPVRRWLRQGAVYGLAGVLAVGDGVSALARGIGRGVREGGAPRIGGGESQPTGAEGGG